MSARRRRLVAVVVAVVTVAACSGGGGPELTGETLPPPTTTTTAPPTTTTTTPPTPTPTSTPTPVEVPCTATRPDTQVTWATFGETAGLQPTVSSGSFLGGTELAAIYDTLVRIDPATGEWVPYLAVAVTPDETGTVWTVELRPDVTFDSGEPLDAEAVVASFERFGGADVRNPARATVAAVAAVEAVDQLTVRFELTRPWWNFPSVLADEPGMIVDPVTGGSPTAQPSGVGPYVVESWTQGRELVLVARDDYWGGPVCVETLRFVFVPGTGETAVAFVDGVLDVAYLRGPDSGLAEARGVAAGEWAEPLGSAFVLLVNHGARGSEPATVDADVRRAVAAAVDGGAVVAAIGDPTLTATPSMLHPDQVLWSAELEEVAAPPESPVDLDGPPALRLVCPNDLRAAADVVAAALRDAGFAVELTVTASIIGVVDAVVAADYDLACWDLSLAGADLGSRLRADLSSTSGANRSGFATAEMDDLLDAFDAARDDDERRAVLAQMAAVVAAEVPWVPIAGRVDALVWADGISGIVPAGPGVYSVAALDRIEPSG